MSDMTPLAGMDAITLRNVTPGTFGLTILASATLAAALGSLALTTVAKTDAANVFTLGQTIQSAAGLTIRQAATQDALILAGSGVGASSRAVTIVGPSTALGASRTFRLPDADVIAAGSAVALTSGQVVVGQTGGLLGGGPDLTYSGGILKIGSSGVTGFIGADSAAGAAAGFYLATLGVNRWNFYKEGSETGSDAGASLVLRARTDAGANIDAAGTISILRAAGGAITLARPVTCSSTLSATSLTATGLTSSRVPFVTTGGLLTNDAGLTYAGAGALNVGDGTASMSVRLNGLNNTVRELRWQTAGLARWRWYVAGNETGANAGGDFNCDTFNDAGAYVDTPIYIIRAAGGAITLARPVTCSLALSAASITATGLTAGLVPFIGTGGLLVNDSGYLYGTAVTTGVGSAGKAVSVGNGVAGANVAMVLNSILTQHKVISFQDGGLIRWALADIATSAQFELRAHDVSGVYIDAPIVVVNAAGGAITLARPTSITNATNSTSDTTGSLTIAGGLGIKDGKDIGIGATTGTKIGQATSKLGFFGKTPVASPAVPTYAAITTAATATATYTATEQGMLGTLKADVIALRAIVVQLTNKLDQTAGSPGLFSGTAT